MAWKSSPNDSGTVTSNTNAGETVIPVTGMTSAAVGRMVVFEAGETWVDAAVVVAFAANNVTIDKPLRGPLVAGDAWVTTEDITLNGGDYSEESNSQGTKWLQKSQIAFSATGAIGFIGITTNTFDIAQSTTSGPFLLESGTRNILGLFEMFFATQSGGSSAVDGNEIIAVGAPGTLWARNTFVHSVQNTILRMTGKGQMWLENFTSIGMTRIELDGDVWWFNVVLVGRANALDIVEIDNQNAGSGGADILEIVGLTMKDMNGFGCQSTANLAHGYDIRNCVFLNPSPRIVRVELGRVWRFINCVFNEALSATNVTFAGVSGSVQDVLRVDYDVTDLSGDPLDSGHPDGGAVIYSHTTGGADTLSIFGRDPVSNLFPVEIIREQITNPGSVWTSSSFSGFFTKTGKYGYQGAILPLTDVRVAETLTGLIPLAIDTNNVAADFTAASTGGNGTSFIHIPTAQTNPLTVVAYDGGSAAVPGAFGATVTCGTATGTLIEYIGDAVSGFIVVDNRNAVAFPDNTAITISGSTFNGLSDTVTFNEDYSWNVDGAGTASFQQAYDYCQALGWEGGGQDEVRKWYSAENGGYLFQTADQTNWFTVRNNTRNGGEGVWLSRLSGGQITTMVADSGAVFTYPQTYTLSLVNLVAGVSVTIVDSTTREELKYELLTGTSTNYTHTGGQTVDILINSLNYDPNLSDVYDLTLPNANSTINYQLIDDPNYENPA